MQPNRGTRHVAKRSEDEAMHKRLLRPDADDVPVLGAIPPLVEDPVGVLEPTAHEPLKDAVRVMVRVPDLALVQGAVHAEQEPVVGTHDGHPPRERLDGRLDEVISQDGAQGQKPSGPAEIARPGQGIVERAPESVALDVGEFALDKGETGLQGWLREIKTVVFDPLLSLVKLLQEGYDLADVPIR
jgi:hypothetical protein